jgi:hypothetical protein
MAFVLKNVIQQRDDKLYAYRKMPSVIGTLA